MLRDEVSDAVRKGQFHIFSATTIDEGIEVLTGKPAGKKGEDGSYPEGTVNYLVDTHLKEMAEKLKGFFYRGEKGDQVEIVLRINAGSFACHYCL